MTLKIIIAGWNENGEKCLLGLIENQIEVVSVLIPKGFDSAGMVDIAVGNNIHVNEVDKGNLESLLEKQHGDLLITASFPWLIKKKNIDQFPLGAINVHASELPKYRGRHPINWAIINDEESIGATIHFLDQQMDSGDIIVQETFPLMQNDTVLTVRDKVTSLGAQLLVKAIKKIKAAGTDVPRKKQDDGNASLAPSRKAEDSRINWNKKTRDIFNLIRASTSPYCAFTYNQEGKKIDIIKSYNSDDIGKVIMKTSDDYFLVTTADGVILVQGKHLKVGDKLT